MMKFARAVISVWDKTGVVDFAKALHDMGVEILSTAARRCVARSRPAGEGRVRIHGLSRDADGRVKTLHPKVHAGILHLRGNASTRATLAQHGLSPIDLVCVNLYPFEATVASRGHPGRRHREHRHRRADHAAVVGEEHGPCHGGHRSGRLRARARVHAGHRRRHDAGTAARAGLQGVRADGGNDAAIAGWLAAQGGVGDGAPPFVRWRRAG
jgi:hypothetical protein